MGPRFDTSDDRQLIHFNRRQTVGTWGAGIFDDDTAADVRADYDAALAEGLDLAAATRRILDAYREERDDVDGGSTVWLGLAAAQVEHGGVDARVRTWVLAWLRQGGPISIAGKRNPEPTMLLNGNEFCAFFTFVSLPWRPLPKRDRQ